ncbi:hypothetical protein EWM64_g445 [Hericium alpestre]|uniref:Uncharacterized protein n=1 Tax=Hericium alpestre TaxID=135208 RepID=A0A4Z0AB49_9AGAM|nr:hypothetical protein EWM64_g445 [Hericium alpestre]
MSGPGPNGIDPGLLEPSDITIAIRKMLGPSAFQRSASLQVDSTVAGPSTSGRSSTAARDVEVVDGSGLLELPAPSCGETRNALSKCCSVSAPASSPLPENELEPASRKRSESITRERRSSDTHTVSSIATANVESQAEPDFSAAAADDLDAPPSQVAPSTSDLPACEPEQSTTVSAVADVTPADVEGESQQGEHGAMALTEEVEAAAPVPAVGIVSGSRYIETGLLDCSSPPTSASGCTAASDFDGGSIFRSEPDVQASTRFHELKAFSILSFLPRRSKGTLPFSDAALASRTSEGPTNAGIKSLFDLRQHHSSYGALPALSPPRTATKPSFRKRHGLPELPQLSTLPQRLRPSSNPVTPDPASATNDRSSFFGRIHGQRPISAYDAPVPAGSHSKSEDAASTNVDTKANGIRVWYSSFTSIDWLHDAIKDSARMHRLRRRKSARGRIRNTVDRSIGWVVVTIVGFLTAIVAFLIVRSEQWLFDLKDGYCQSTWWKAKRFCCPAVCDDEDFSLFVVDNLRNALVDAEETCIAWRSWGQVLDRPGSSTSSQEVIDYFAYILFALILALTSCALTLKLTKSTSFVTRKDSGVLAPEFANEDGGAGVSATPASPPARRQIMYYAAGSGIPEIKSILSGFVIHGYLGGRTLFTKSVGLALSTASGLSLGKEGPFVHIASCIGNIVSRYFHKYENNEGKRREVLSAACAAGVAVAFGAPIGGTLFSLEEVSYFFPPKVMWRSFFCAMIAAITLRFLDPFGTGKLVMLQVTYDKDWHAYELVPFLLLGVFGGVYGAWFSKLNYRWSRDVRSKTWLARHPAAEVALITLLTALCSFVNPYTHMGGTELVYNFFAECRAGSANTHSDLCVLDPATQTWPVIQAIFITLVIKAALTIVTFGIKLPAGIFIPTLGVGACAGRIMGVLVQYAQWRWPHSSLFSVCRGDLDCVIPGLYAMVGAAAALSGVTRTTVSLAVIMFELTDTLTYAVPVMLAVLAAKTVADALEPKGIYDLVIELAQLPYLDAKHDYIWGHLEISDVANRDVDVIRLDRPNTVKTIRDQLQELVKVGYDDSGFPILRDDEGGSRMVGYIGANELEHALSIVADEADIVVHFHSQKQFGRPSMSSSSVSSLFVEGATRPELDPFDFSVYMDQIETQAPLTVQSNSPLEVVQQFFVKLGAKYVVVIDNDGYYEGVIDKKAWVGFLGKLEQKSL